MTPGSMTAPPGPSAPQLRTARATVLHAMVYDTARQRVVLFGGVSAPIGSVNDTWEYDGTTWTQRTPASAPPAREYPAMAYDSTHQVTVLFGGFPSLNDTWLWNGTTWSAPMQVQTAPVIDMSARPDGIWHYTTIDIPAGTTVSFKRQSRQHTSGMAGYWPRTHCWDD